MTRLKPLVATLLSSAIVVAAPGFDAYRVFAQEVVRTNIPVSPAAGVGAAGAGITTGRGATLSFGGGLGLPTSVINASPRTLTNVAINPALGLGGGGSRATALGGSDKASPGAKNAAATGLAGGSLLQRALWKDAAPGRPAEPTALGRAYDRLAQPALQIPEGGSTEELQQKADSDFSARRGAEGVARDAAEEAPSEARTLAGTLAVEGPGKTPLQIQAVRPQDVGTRQYRSVVAPAAAAAAAAAVWFAATAIPAALAWAGTAVGAQSAVLAVQHAGPLTTALNGVWSAISYGAFGATAVLATYAILDATLFAAAVWSGRNVSEDQFHGSVRSALREMGLGPAAVAGLAGHLPGRGVIHAYRGGNLKTRLSFGFTTAHGVYLRPELAKFPWALKLVLRHELYPYYQNRQRGPPGSPKAEEAGVLRSIAGEFGSRIQELRPGKWLGDLKISVLERVLREAQVAVSLPYEYDVLVVKPEAGTLRDSEQLKALSGGKARINAVEGLGELEGKTSSARLIVTPGAAEWLPRGDSEASKQQLARLERALKQLDEQYLLSKGLNPTGAASKNPAWKELEQLTKRGRSHDDPDVEKLQRVLSVLWRQVAATQLKDVEVVRAIGRLYGRLQDRGT
ncbi:MAG: hypothetical protein HY925_07710, partial [Elusimicrobia bacterium]|nr:hypothetical protein [Elusimicrobiota bacterium]